MCCPTDHAFVPSLEAPAYSSDVSPEPRLACSQDVQSWLDVVLEVEGLFGPMPDFEGHIRRGVRRGTALVVVGDDDRVAEGPGAAAPSEPGA